LKFNFFVLDLLSEDSNLLVSLVEATHITRVRDCNFNNSLQNEIKKITLRPNLKHSFTLSQFYILHAGKYIEKNVVFDVSLLKERMNMQN
jgi:archaellum component FlaF (FlaF/FlaG flagellin family)